MIFISRPYLILNSAQIYFNLAYALKSTQTDIRIAPNPSEEEVDNGIKEIIDNYYPGYWIDSFTEPNVMKDENILKLSMAFSDILVSN